MSLSAYAQSPGITNSPASATRMQGDNHTFTVQGTNFSGAAFAWYFNDVLIPGAITNTFTLYNIGWTNAGRYQVIVSKASVSSTSAVAILTVTPISGVFFDFDSPGALTNNFNSRGGANASDSTINGFYGSAVWGEAPTQGAGNSGSLAAYATANTTTLIDYRQPFNFSPTGAILNASIMFKYKSPTVQAAPDKQVMYLGFMASTNIVNTNYAGNLSAANSSSMVALNATNAVFGMPISVTYVAARLNLLTNSAATNTELIMEYKDLLLPITQRKAGVVGGLVPGEWYRLNLTMTNYKAVTAGKILTLATLQDMGPDGLGTPTTVLSFATNLISATSTVTNSMIYLALSPVDYYGVDRMDNLAAWMEDGPLGITTPLLDQTVLQNRSVTFTAAVRGTPPYYCQWMKDGEDIPGATKPAYTIAQAASTDAGSYSVRITNANYTVTSAPAALSITPDAAPPNLLSVGSLNGGRIGVRFDEALSSGTAINSENYSVTGGGAVTGVSLRPGNQEVELTLDTPATGSFTVNVSGVQDLAGNAIVATNMSGTVLNLTPFDVGGEDGVLPLTPGSSYTSKDGEITTLAGGMELGGTNDDGHLLLGARSGDFDVKVRVQSMTRSTLWNPVPGNDEMARAGLVARASSAPNSRSIQITAMPIDLGDPSGYNRYELGYRPDDGVKMTNVTGTTVTNVVPYPQGWMRLRKVNTTVSLYRSGDGINWTNLASLTDPNLPNDMLVGLGATAHLKTDLPNRPVGVEFRNYGDIVFSGATITSVDLRPALTNLVVPNSYVVTAVVAVANVPLREVQYIWQRTNSTAGGWTNIPFASSISSSLTTPTFTGFDERDFSSWVFRCIVEVSGIPAVTSGVSMVTGYTDTNPPAIVSGGVSCPSGSASNILVTISKAATLDSLLNLSNYLVTNAVTGEIIPLTGITLINNGPDTATVLLTAGTNISGTFKIVGTGFVDFAYPPNTNTTGTPRQFTGAAALSPVFVESYYAMSVSDQNLIDSLTNYSRFLDHAFNAYSYQPTMYYNTSGHDNDGNIAMSYFVPSSTGTFKFWIEGDDGVMMRMNTNSVNSTDPLGRVTIVYQAYYIDNLYHNYSGPVYLEAGKRYWMEVLNKNGTGGDDLGATVRAYTDLITPDTAEHLGAANLVAPIGPAYIANVTPSSLTIQEGGYATFTASGIGGALPYYARWFKGGVYYPSTSNKYTATLGPFTCADTNVTFVVSNFWSVGQFVVPVTVVMDTNKPVALSATGNGLNHFYVQCSTRMDPVTVANVANYNIPGLTVLKGSVYNGNVIAIKTSPQAQGVSYSISINNIKSGNCTAALMDPTTLNATTETVTRGVIWREFYTGLTGNYVTDLTNTTKFLNHTPDLVDINNSAMTPTNWGLNYGAVIYGYVVPPVTGPYTFYMIHDDGGQFILSTDDGKENGILQLAADCCHNGFDNSFSKTVNLTANQYYYFEARVKQGLGLDSLRIGVHTPLDPSGLPSAPMIGSILATGVNTNALQPPVITIVQQPVNAPDTIENTTAPFSVAATNSANWNHGYQWQHYDTASSSWVDIYYGTSSNLNWLVTCHDDGALVRVRVTVPGSTVYSDTVTVHVLPDIVPPQIVKVSGDLQADRFTVRFNEKLTAATANNAANYGFSGGLAVLSATLQPDGKSVLCIVDGLIVNNTYTVTVSNVTDIACLPNPMPPTTSPPFSTPWPRAAGYVQVQQWNTVIPSAQMNVSWSLAFLTGDPRYPLAPDLTLYTNVTDWPQTAPDTENYGIRMTGLIIPPGTGNYSFRIVADDSAKLTIGKNGDISKNSVVIDSEGSCAACSGVSGSYSMVAGDTYMFEVLFLEGTGGDYMHLTWSGPNIPVMTNIFSTNLAFTVDPDIVDLATLRHPADSTILEGRRATFLAQATATVGIPSYQWQYYDATNTLAWVDIPGANSPVFNTDYLCEEANATQFRAVIGLSLVNGLITRTNITTTATLTVLPDEVPPYIVSVGSLDGSTIGVVFNEPIRMDVSGFTLYDNWNVLDANIMANVFDTNGNQTFLDFPVTQVIAWPDTNAIYTDKLVLKLPSVADGNWPDWSTKNIEGWAPPFLNGPFTVMVGSVVDTACRMNSTGPYMTGADSLPMGLNLVDIWGPQPAGFAFVGSANRVSVRAGGADIWNQGDQFTFLEKQIEGDFDARVTVIGIPDPPAPAPNVWSKASIMLRGSIIGTDGTDTNSNLGVATNSLMAYITTTPTNGSRVFSSGIRYDNGAGAVDFPGGSAGYDGLYVFPAVIRMVREGSLITTFSWNYITNIVTDTNTQPPVSTTNVLGPQWVTNSVADTTNWPSQMFIGLATTSHSQGTGVQATYEDFKLIDRPIIETQPEGTTNVAGTEIVLSVTASGPAEGNPLRYQWRKNGANIPGANGSTLTLASPGPLDSGDYSVEVRNSAGAVLSADALLLVLGPPWIVTQPADQSAVCFGSATFGVLANTNPGDDMGYQWQLHGTNIPGANSSILTVDNLTVENAGPYSVVITNSIGTTISSNAWVILSDTVAPTIICPDNMTVECGAPVTFDVPAVNSCGVVMAVSCTPPSGSVFPVGPTTVNCITTDLGTPTASCSFIVTAADTLPPVISGCSTNITTTNTVVTWTAPTAVDGCLGTVPVVCTPPSGSTFSAGTTEVVCQAADNAGHTATCSFTVTVEQQGGPISLSIASQEGGVLVSWPTSPAGYGLQYTYSLGFTPATNWVNYPGPFTTNGVTISTPVSITTNSMFFRLTK